MANTRSPAPGRRAGGCRRCTRGDLLAVALAAMLCSATYCLSIWHNSRGAAPDSSVLGPTADVVAATVCGGQEDELDFEAHHTAENAGLSVSAAAATTPTARPQRRALGAEARRAPAAYRGPFPWPASGGVAWAGNSALGAVAAAAGERRARVDGDRLRFTDATAARAYADATAARAYADAVFRLVPARPRTALDVGAMIPKFRKAIRKIS